MKKQYIKIILIAVIAIAAACAVLTLALNAALSPDTYDLKLVSPDGEHVITVRESTFLMGGSVDIYYRPSGEKNLFPWQEPGTCVGTFALDDGLCPFESGSCEVTWSDGGVTIRFPRYKSAEPETFEYEFPIE